MSPRLRHRATSIAAAAAAAIALAAPAAHSAAFADHASNDVLARCSPGWPRS